MKVSRCLAALLSLIAITGLALAGDVPFAGEPLDNIRKAIKEGRASLVDVRARDEWDAGHLKQAIFLPVTELAKAKTAPADLPKDRPLYLHCVAGVRAKKAAGILSGLGFDARPIEAGYEELLKNGFEKAGAEKVKSQ